MTPSGFETTTIGQGLETATSEITLVLFTTLAPSGLFALVVLSLYLLFARLSPKQRSDINIRTILPNIITLTGLVASATHLGNPANALYVFMRVGKSPLSSEVFAVVLCLLFAGTYWLYSFSLKPKLGLQKLWLAIIAVLGLVAIGFIAIAYDVRTIITWNTIHVPVNLWLNAIIGGSLLALLTLQIAKAPGFVTAKPRVSGAAGGPDVGSGSGAAGEHEVGSATGAMDAAGETGATDVPVETGTPKPAASRFALALCAVAGLALVANTISMLMQNAALASKVNAVAAATDLVPFYIFVILAFVLLVLAGLLIFALRLYRGRLPRLREAYIACILVFVGIFLTRFTFYMMHMTAGLAV